MEEDIALQNRWIYTEMAQNYFWADRMKDSLDCNYALPPDQFFKTLIVEEDRFSYCYPNAEYCPPTKGTDLNESVKLDSIYVIDGTRIGYFYYSEFESEADITDVILKMKGVEELILDVRNNPGGYVATCIYLSSLIAPKEVRGKLFCSYRYNERISRINEEKTGDKYTYSYFKDDALTANRSLSLKRLYVLTGPRSASASELLINCLRPYMPVIVIGTSTTGKDVGMSPLSSRYCKYVLMPITFRTYNADGIPVPITGIVPDLPYDMDSVTGSIGDINETLLGKAIEEIIKTKNIK
ncbi:MAG: S41 family peptidase [Bacteroidales bacterium]|nr:S41 family peptidase [Bacteroidales bacterium]